MTSKQKNSAGIFFSLSFLIPAILFVFMATSLRPLLGTLKEHYSKESIELRKSLHEFNLSYLPSFVSDWSFTTEKAKDDVETQEYVIGRMAHKNSKAFPNKAAVFVTYYSEPGNQIPHTPDVCARQGGATVLEKRFITIDVPGLKGTSKEVEVCLLKLREAGVCTLVLYTICAEGQFRATRGEARWILDKPGNKRVYFSKIESLVFYPVDYTTEQETQVLALGKKLFVETVRPLVEHFYPTQEDLMR